MSSSSLTSAVMTPPASTDGDIPHFLFPGPDPEDRQRKGWSLLVSLTAQVVGVIVLLWLAHLLPPRTRFLYPISQRRWTVVHLDASAVPPPSVRLPRRPVIPPHLEARQPETVIPTIPRTGPEPRMTPPAPVAVPALRAGPSQPVELRHPLDVAPPATRPALKVDPPKVQVGAFGDPHGIAAPATTAAANAPRFGTFDSGDASQAAMASPSAPKTGAFAALDGPAAPGSSHSQLQVRIHSFDPAPPPGQLPVLHPAQASPRLSAHPPVILSHPLPVYTALAQRNRIEGEVVLEAVLQRDGIVRVVRVVQGLGYGLDQSAREAAQKLRFRPALRDGQPVDWTVLLHITFRLAY